MEQASTIQERLFQIIKNSLPPHISFVHDLSELLQISYDSAYRRIRGEKEISIEELHLVCLHYKISADSLFNLRSNHVVFDSLAIGEDGLDIEKWLQSLLAAIKIIHAAISVLWERRNVFMSFAYIFSLF